MKTRAAVFAVLFGLAAGACDDDSGSAEEEHDDHGDDHGHDHDHDHDHDGDDPGHGIDMVSLTFTPDGGDALTFSFSDPDGPGGMSGMAEEIQLAPNTRYVVQLELAAELEGEDITALVEDDAEDHMVLIHGDSISGPASNGDGFMTHEYNDVESDYGPNDVGDDLPVGLSSIITTTDAGEAELSLIVRHVPPVNDAPQKTADLPETFARGEEIAGVNDVDVTFDVTVE